jgi:hypothetical protein
VTKQHLQVRNHTPKLYCTQTVLHKCATQYTTTTTTTTVPAAGCCRGLLHASPGNAVAGCADKPIPTHLMHQPTQTRTLCNTGPTLIISLSALIGFLSDLSRCQTWCRSLLAWQPHSLLPTHTPNQTTNSWHTHHQHAQATNTRCCAHTTPSMCLPGYQHKEGLQETTCTDT